VCLVAAACAALPDIDYVGWPFPHRSITHSIVFAVGVAVAAAFVLFRSPEWKQDRARIAVALGLAALSHSVLDGLSSYSFGIEYFAPFSSQRFRLAWTPLGNAQGHLASQLLQEFIVVLLPALVLGWLAFRLGRRRRPNITVSAIVLSRHGRPAWDYRTPIPGRDFAGWRRMRKRRSINKPRAVTSVRLSAARRSCRRHRRSSTRPTSHPSTPVTTGGIFRRTCRLLSVKIRCLPAFGL
jgi:inner membrane protein